MSSNVPTDLKYASSHEWVRVEGDVATIGISDHAQAELTELVFVELPEVGRELKAGDASAVVESVKTASDVYAPVSGEVIEVNTALEETPELINKSAHGDGWVFKIRPDDATKLVEMMDAEAYQRLLAELED